MYNSDWSIEGHRYNACSVIIAPCGRDQQCWKNVVTIVLRSILPLIIVFLLYISFKPFSRISRKSIALIAHLPVPYVTGTVTSEVGSHIFKVLSPPPHSTASTQCQAASQHPLECDTPPPPPPPPPLVPVPALRCPRWGTRSVASPSST